MKTYRVIATKGVLVSYLAFIEAMTKEAALEAAKTRYIPKAVPYDALVAEHVIPDKSL